MQPISTRPFRRLLLGALFALLAATQLGGCFGGCVSRGDNGSYAGACAGGMGF